MDAPAQMTAAVAGAATWVAAADIDRDGDLDADALSASRYDARLARCENLGQRIHDDGFDSDANDTCWSSAVP